MAKVKIQRHASGTGVLTVTAPNTSSDRTITLPDATGTLLNSDGDGSSLTSLPAHTGNVAFPATQVASADANTLDDYEEGTWTPVYEDGSGNAGTTTGGGAYTKIGDLVYATFQATCSNLNSMSGGVRMTGMPFTSANNATYPSGVVGYMSSLATTAGYSVHYFMNPNTAYLEFYLNDSTAGTTGLQHSELSTSGQMFGSISYKA